MAIDNEKLITLGGLAEYNKSIPDTAFKAILQSQKNILWTPDEIRSHIFPVDFDLNDTLCNSRTMTAGSAVIEYPVPDGAKYVHFFASFDGCFIKDMCGDLNIYMSIKDNSKITFVEDGSSEYGYKAIIPDGVKLIHGRGLGEEGLSHIGMMKAEYGNPRSGAIISEAEFPIEISDHAGKLYIQFNFAGLHMKSNVENVPETVYASYWATEKKDIELGPNSCIYDEFYPVFYDHYGIAVSTWSTNWRNAMFGETSFVKL